MHTAPKLIVQRLFTESLQHMKEKQDEMQHKYDPDLIYGFKPALNQKSLKLTRASAASDFYERIKQWDVARATRIHDMRLRLWRNELGEM